MCNGTAKRMCALPVLWVLALRMIATGHACVGALLGALGPIGYPLALFSHLPLDLLNEVWCHGWGEGRLRWLYGAFNVVAGLALLSLTVDKPHLWGYMVVACLPDFEHPVRLLKHKKGYWLHRWLGRPLRDAWGLLAWTVFLTFLLLAISYQL